MKHMAPSRLTEVLSTLATGVILSGVLLGAGQFPFHSDTGTAAPAPSSLAPLVFGGPPALPNLPAEAGTVGPSSSGAIAQIPPANTGTGIPVGKGPAGVLYDPLDQQVFVANFASGNPGNGSPGNISVLDGTTYHPASSPISVGLNPVALSLNTSNDTIFVANLGSNNLTVVDGGTNRVLVRDIPTGHNPIALAYDSKNGFTYVVNWLSDNVTVVTHTNLSRLPNGTITWVPGPSIPVGVRPVGIAYDDRNGLLYVANYGSWTVNNSATITVINGTTNQVQGPPISVPTQPTAVSYDPVNGRVYVESFICNLVVGNLTVIDPANRTVDRSAIPVGNQCPPTIYPISAMALASDTNFLYVPNEGSGNLSVINLANEKVVVPSEGAGSAPDGAAYDVLTGQVLVSNFGSDNLTAVQASRAGSLNIVRFIESGLPAGSSLTLAISNSNYGNQSASGQGSEVEFSLLNGSYQYLVSPVAGYWTNYRGTVLVQGASVNRTVVFAPFTYRISFIETGLPDGILWGVRIDGVTATSSSPGELSLSEPNGTYSYTVSPNPGYMASWTGIVYVNASADAVTVHFSQVKYTLTFEESGLPKGTDWGLTVGNLSAVSDRSNLTVELPNGTYLFVVTPVAGYTVNSSSQIEVSGENTSASLSFLPSTPPVSGAGPITSWAIPLLAGTILGIAVGAGIAYTLLLRSRPKQH